jgi:hypothetical protein
VLFLGIGRRDERRRRLDVFLKPPPALIIILAIPSMDWPPTGGAAKDPSGGSANLHGLVNKLASLAGKRHSA